jgi:putative SOS response-associated peptidase YedK
MCGRYTLSTPGEQLAEVFGVEESVVLEPRFNIAPTQQAPVVLAGSDGGSPVMEMFTWGLVPYWAKDPSMGGRMINARAETVGERKAFKEAVRRRRCLVPADGFYEWKKIGKVKQPYYFSRPDGDPLALAGLWEQWRGDGRELRSFSLITTEANETVAPVHHRMPVILDSENWQTWLGVEGEDAEALHGLLRPGEAGWLTCWPVSTRVNSPANDSSLCLERVEEPVESEQGSDLSPADQRSLF